MFLDNTEKVETLWNRCYSMLVKSCCRCRTFSMLFFCKCLSSRLSDQLTRSQYETYHLGHKQIFTGFKILVFLDKNSCLESLVCVHDGMLNFVWRESWTGYSIKMFVKKVVMGNAVQIFSNFPAKSLSIYRAKFLITPL